jgi:hypothetical protein
MVGCQDFRAPPGFCDLLDQYLLAPFCSPSLMVVPDEISLHPERVRSMGTEWASEIQTNSCGYLSQNGSFEGYLCGFQHNTIWGDFAALHVLSY